MLGLMKKDLPVSALQNAVMMGMLYVYWFVAYRPVNAPMTILTGGYVFMLIMNMVLISESLEDRNNGYAFLYTLPLSIQEIVMSKFALPLLLTCFLVVFNGIMFSFLPNTADTLAFARVYVLGCGILGLLFVGLGYIGMYAFGFTLFIKAALIAAMIIVLALPILILEVFLSGADLDTLQVTFVHADWPVIILIFLAVYGGLMMTAIRLKAARLMV